VNKLHVYLVDDHPVVRNGLRTLVQDEPDMEVVGEAYDGANAVHEVIELQPDVVVMDVSMPGMGGIEATARIHEKCPDVRILALTAHEDRSYFRQVIASGASGYVLKRSAAAVLVEAIRQVAAGNNYVDLSLAAPAAVGHEIAAEADEADLSEREVEVLKQIARGYANKQIAAQLGISVKTVETYKARGMEKLGARSRVDIVRYAHDRGWLTESQGRMQPLSLS
jgi:DNA-binding NarL/FixJ family response regulator